MLFANRLIYNSRSLLKKLTNNIAECYNNLIAKFIGGKIVDHWKKGSYGLRCHAAGITFNEEPEYYSIIHKSITGKSPGEHTKTYIYRKRNKIEVYRKKLLHSESKFLHKIVANKCQKADEDYRNVQPMITEDQLTWRKNNSLQTYKKHKNK